MESSNSGSFQSSSGGAADNNQEYDSTTTISSNLLNHHHHHQHQHPPSNHHFNHQPQPPPSSFSPNLNPLQHHGSLWTGPIPPVQPDRNLTYPTINPPNPSTIHNTNTYTKTGRGSDHGKNPKKRTRASRRAPTTVLTTDTTNFRQMVQEFTGIPTSPFTTAPFSRRLELFGRPGDGAAGTTGLVIPLRPSAQKIQQQPPPFLNSTPTVNIVESGITSSNYQLHPSNIQEFQKQPSSFLDLQNPMLSFQSLLQQTTLPQQSNDLSGYPSSSKRWRGQDEKLESFEGVIGNNQNIGGSKITSSGLENVVVSSRSGGDQSQGNGASWICPSS